MCSDDSVRATKKLNKQQEHITKLINSFHVFLAMHTFPICFISSSKVKLIQIMIQRRAHIQILLCVCVSPSTLFVRRFYGNDALRNIKINSNHI